jgi:hypothetical protein
MGPSPFFPQLHISFQKGIRVLVLPAVELDAGEKLETVVAVEYKVEEKENGLKSRFKIR